MHKLLRRSRRRLFSPMLWRTRLGYWLSAVLVGLLATAFAMLSDAANGFVQRWSAQAPFAIFVVAPLALVAVAWMTRHWFPGAQGSGIPQTLAALEHPTLRGAVLSLRIGFGKMLLTLVGLCAGASIGREGPTVHVGAAVMYSIGRRLRLDWAHVERSLILSGGAAGVAAAFNTPLAGIVFAIEELSRSFDERTNGYVLAAVVLAGATAVTVLGNYNYFGQVHVEARGIDWLAVPVCALVGGTLGGLFSRTLLSSSRRLAGFSARRPLLLAALCGLAVALFGFLSGGSSYGTGYHEARAVVESGAGDAGYPLFKLAATVASYLSGIPGGIFAPSLAIGAGLGADLARLLPGLAPQALVLFGMVGYFSGVVQTPITAFVIVMEMTDDHAMLLPLMATAFLAHLISQQVCPEPIYRGLAHAFVARRQEGGAGSASAQVSNPGAT